MRSLPSISAANARSLAVETSICIRRIGPLPPGAPPVCEFFRQLPDALEQAAELDAQYGRNPDLEKMPMYGVVFSFKDSVRYARHAVDRRWRRAYDIDFPARDHVLVEQLRKKGAIIFAKAVSTEYNGRAGDPGGRTQPNKVLPSTLGYQRRPGPAIPRIHTIRRAPPRSARVPARRYQSAPTW